MIVEDKVLVHFDTEYVRVYITRSNKLELLSEDKIAFNEKLIDGSLLETVDKFLNTLQSRVGIVNCERIRLYATGVFQRFSLMDQEDLIVHIFVYFGLLLNFISPELEQFYHEKSISTYGTYNMMEGLMGQEFRKVVVCGSFQQHMTEIESVISILDKRDIVVLSPWTTKIIPESLGTDFILLEGQELINERDVWRHKWIHMNKFKQSDAVIICNPGGTVGNGTMFEFGFMVAYSKRIIFTEKPTGISFPFPYEVGLNFC